MIFLENTQQNQEQIEGSILKYGYAPEHNYWWYRSQAEEGSENIFVKFENGEGLFTINEPEKKKCYVFSSPIAADNHRVKLLVDYINFIFSQGVIEKVVLELEEKLYNEFVRSMPQNMRACRINYKLTWPIHNLEQFDENLAGRKWKTIRKERNNFYGSHTVLMQDAKTYGNKKELVDIVKKWRKERGARDRAHFNPYCNFIESNFMGASEARVMVVDGKAVGINAGWMVPNSKKYYGAMGIHDYSLPNLGDMLYLEDLLWLKAHGYKEADMGGGEEGLTNFKRKFSPQSFYKTCIFSVVKNK